jgi:hypothetical protein
MSKSLSRLGHVYSDAKFRKLFGRNGEFRVENKRKTSLIEVMFNVQSC